MLLTKAPKRTGKGAHMVAGTYGGMTDEAIFIISSLNLRNMTITQLAGLCGVARATIDNALHKKMSQLQYYGMLYVLTHSYYDTELKKWVVID